MGLTQYPGMTNYTVLLEKNRKTKVGVRQCDGSWR